MFLWLLNYYHFSIFKYTFGPTITLSLSSSLLKVIILSFSLSLCFYIIKYFPYVPYLSLSISGISYTYHASLFDLPFASPLSSCSASWNILGITCTRHSHSFLTVHTIAVAGILASLFLEISNCPMTKCSYLYVHLIIGCILLFWPILFTALEIHSILHQLQK